VRFAAERIASSDRLMGVVEDLMNEANFAGLSQHEEMLSDSVRIEAYHRGIHRNVRPGDVVLDLGSGTGVLAFMASRAGASKVYAVEHSDFIEVAREIGRDNGFTNVEFVQANSREFTPPEPVDVVVHEQMGDELFNENMLHNLLDLRGRVLRPGGRFLPTRFRLFVEPVTFHDAFRVRRFWNIDLPDGIDVAGVQHSLAAAKFDLGQNEIFWARPGSVAAMVGEPTPLIEFDVSTLDDVMAIPTEYVIERVATVDAIVDGVCVWFEAEFDPETVLTTSPLAPLTSWGNRVFRLDREVEAGDTVRVELQMPRLVDPNTWFVVG
jgi:protein arginine N-methyltransferase 1